MHFVSQLKDQNMSASIIHLGISRHLLLAMLVASTVVGSQAQVSKKKYTQKDLPAPVLAAFQKEYPKATIKEVSIEKSNGVTYWEIGSVDGKTTRDLLYLPEGKKVETEETIEYSQVPAVVRKTLSSQYPQGKVPKSEKLTKGNLVTYEFQVQDGSATHEVVIASDGKLLKGGMKAS